MTKSQKTSKQGIMSSFFLMLGIMVVFLSLALLFKAGQVWLGLFLNTHVIEFNILMAVLLFTFGLLMIFELDMAIFYRLPTLIRTNLSTSSENSFISSFYLGLSYTAIAAPCAAPIFLGLIMLILIFDPLVIFTIIVEYALGSGLPFVVIGSLIPHITYNLNSQFNKIARWIKPISGVILTMMSIFLINAYYFPYYPLRLNEFIFRGVNEYFLFEIYLTILGLPLLILSTIIIENYFKKIYKDKKQKTKSNLG